MWNVRFQGERRGEKRTNERTRRAKRSSRRTTAFNRCAPNSNRRKTNCNAIERIWICTERKSECCRNSFEFFDKTIRRFPVCSNGRKTKRSYGKTRDERFFRSFSSSISWSSRLQMARVTRWGGMISTPDDILQKVIRRALLESGCPTNVTNELMENAHERHWPQGLATLGKTDRRRKIEKSRFSAFVKKRDKSIDDTTKVTSADGSSASRR